jgi:hypothetical protein
MRHAFIGLCIFTAACSSQPFSPTSPSGVAGVGVQTQASGGAPVEVTFTKWSTGFPGLAGVTGGDVPGTFAGTVLSRDPFDNGTIVQLEAQYGVIATDGAHSFVAHIEGKQNNPTRQAVFNGTVIDGWLGGAQVHVTYDVIDPAPGTSCVPAAPVNRALLPGHDSHSARLGELKEKWRKASVGYERDCAANLSS